MKSQSMRYLAIAGCVAGLAALLVSCAKSTTQTAKPAPAEQMAMAAMVTAGPDLIVTNVSAPASASRGSTINVVHVTANIGNQVSAGTSKNYFYLWPICSNITTGYINPQLVGSIMAGKFKTLTDSSFIVPTNAALGANYIIVLTGITAADVNHANDTNCTCTINITQ